MTVVDRTDPAVRFSARFDLGTFTDTCEEPKLELRATCYVPSPAARVDPSCWQCWSGLSGTITALPGSAYTGLILATTRFMNQPQYGPGANGKNSHLGLSFWFLFTVVSPSDTSLPGVRPVPRLPAEPHGDVNIDLIPPPPVVEPPQFKGDPHFVGFCNNVPSCRYDFHGERDKVFAIISDRNLQLNARFVGADLRPQKIFKTYIGSIGLRLPSARIRVECDRVSERHIIQIDGQELESMSVKSFDTPDGPATVTRDDQDRVSIDLPRYYLKLRFSSSGHSSCHINMRANYRTIVPTPHGKHSVGASSMPPHGVLGQTADPSRNFPAFGVGPQGEGIVEGRWQDYLIEGDDLFGTQFSFTRWATTGLLASSDDDSEELENDFPERKRILRDPFDDLEKIVAAEEDDDNDEQRHSDDNIVEKSAAVH
jgi:hypothetical protein